MPQSLRELPQRISQATANIAESEWRRTWEEFEYRIAVCRGTKGVHVECLYINILGFLAVFGIFHVCICNRFENSQIYYDLNHL
jgi:hypothetical protein